MVLAVAVEESGVVLDDVSGVIIVGGVEVAGVIVESDVGGAGEAVVGVEMVLSGLVAIAGNEVAVVVEVWT